MLQLCQNGCNSKMVAPKTLVAHIGCNVDLVVNVTLGSLRAFSQYVYNGTYV